MFVNDLSFFRCPNLNLLEIKFTHMMAKIANYHRYLSLHSNNMQ